MRGKVLGVLVALLIAVGTAAAQGNGTANDTVTASDKVIQNLVGLGVWAFIGIGLIFAIVLGVAYVIGNVMMYKSQEMASRQLANTTRYGVESLVNISLLRTIDDSLDNDSFSKLEKLKLWLKNQGGQNTQ